MKISKAFPSEFMRAADIKEMAPINGKIDHFAIKELNDGDKPAIGFSNLDGWLILNKTNASMLSHLIGDETDEWPGKTIGLKVEPVAFQGKVVDAIRVCPPIDFDDDLPF